MYKGKKIYQLTDEFGELFVSENKQYRWLSFDNAYIQTIINKQSPWLPELCYLQSLCSTISNPCAKVLILGAGGGGLIHFLHHYFPKIDIHAVDLRNEVINIAKTFFYVDLNIINACAWQYMQDLKESYDYIFIDIFTGEDKVPKQNLHTLLMSHSIKSAGIVSINLLFNNKQTMYKEIKYIRENISDKTLLLTTSSRQNIVLHIFFTNEYLTLIEHLVRANRIERPLWDGTLGAISRLYFE